MLGFLSLRALATGVVVAAVVGLAALRRLDWGLGIFLILAFLHFTLFPLVEFATGEALFLPYFAALGCLYAVVTRRLLRGRSSDRDTGPLGLLVLVWTVYLAIHFVAGIRNASLSIFSDALFLLVIPIAIFLARPWMDQRALSGLAAVSMLIGATASTLALLGSAGLLPAAMLDVRWHLATPRIDVYGVGQHQSLAFHAAVGLIVLVSLWPTMFRWRSLAVGVGLAFLLFAGVIVTASRTVWLGTACALLVTAVVGTSSLRSSACTSRGSRRPVVAAASLLAIVAAVLASTGTSPFVRLASILSIGVRRALGQVADLGGRVSYWSEVFGDELARTPVWGRGLGSFVSAAELRQGGSAVGGLPAADSSYLYLYLQLGGLGLMLALAIAAVTIRRLGLRWSGIDRSLRRCVLGMALFFGVTTLLLDALRMPALAVMFYAVIVAGLGPAAEPRHPNHAGCSDNPP